jgi:hypothetical protein
MNTTVKNLVSEAEFAAKIAEAKIKIVNMSKRHGSISGVRTVDAELAALCDPYDTSANEKAKMKLYEDFAYWLNELDLSKLS